MNEGKDHGSEERTLKERENSNNKMEPKEFSQFLGQAQNENHEEMKKADSFDSKLHRSTDSMGTE